MKAIFSHSTKETKTDIHSFFFKPENHFPFTAGQYTELTLDGNLKHFFTISSAPGKSKISITTRVRNTPFKKALSRLRKGDEVDLALAAGDFVLPKNKDLPVLLVAAGIGITPVWSILKDEFQKKDKRNLNLLYGAASKSDFLDLRPYDRKLSGYEKITRRIEEEDIFSAAKKLSEPYIYISGPEKMVELLIGLLREKDIAESRLIADYFPGY